MNKLKSAHNYNIQKYAAKSPNGDKRLKVILYILRSFRLAIANAMLMKQKNANGKEIYNLVLIKIIPKIIIIKLNSRTSSFVKTVLLLSDFISAYSLYMVQK